MIDIVFPNKNEEAFIRLAKKLSYDELCFVYNLKNFPTKKNKYNLKIKYGILTDEKNIQKAKKLCDTIFIKSQNIRNLVEKNKNIIIFDIEQDSKRDFIHQRRSGLNHILCNLANKNHIKIGLNFNSLLNSNITKRNSSIGRITSNIKLCKKYNVKIIVGSFANEPYEMRSFQDLKTFFLTLRLNKPFKL